MNKRKVKKEKRNIESFAVMGKGERVCFGIRQKCPVACWINKSVAPHECIKGIGRHNLAKSGGGLCTYCISTHLIFTKAKHSQMMNKALSGDNVYQIHINKIHNCVHEIAGLLQLNVSLVQINKFDSSKHSPSGKQIRSNS